MKKVLATAVVMIGMNVSVSAEVKVEMTDMRAQIQAICPDLNNAALMGFSVSGLRHKVIRSLIEFNKHVVAASHMQIPTADIKLTAEELKEVYVESAGKSKEVMDAVAAEKLNKKVEELKEAFPAYVMSLSQGAESIIADLKTKPEGDALSKEEAQRAGSTLNGLIAFGAFQHQAMVPGFRANIPPYCIQ